VAHITVPHSLGRPPALPTNIVVDSKKLAKGKHPNSAYYTAASEQTKEPFYSIDTRLTFSAFSSDDEGGSAVFSCVLGGDTTGVTDGLLSGRE
jgi:hypothetical protein